MCNLARKDRSRGMESFALRSLNRGSTRKENLMFAQNHFAKSRMSDMPKVDADLIDPKARFRSFFFRCRGQRQWR